MKVFLKIEDFKPGDKRFINAVVALLEMQLDVAVVKEGLTDKPEKSIKPRKLTIFDYAGKPYVVPEGYQGWNSKNKLRPEMQEARKVPASRRKENPGKARKSSRKKLVSLPES